MKTQIEIPQKINPFTPTYWGYSIEYVEGCMLVLFDPLNNCSKTPISEFALAYRKEFRSQQDLKDHIRNSNDVFILNATEL